MQSHDRKDIIETLSKDIIKIIKKVSLNVGIPKQKMFEGIEKENLEESRTKSVCVPREKMRIYPELVIKEMSEEIIENIKHLAQRTGVSKESIIVELLRENFEEEMMERIEKAKIEKKQSEGALKLREEMREELKEGLKKWL